MYTLSCLKQSFPNKIQNNRNVSVCGILATSFFLVCSCALSFQCVCQSVSLSVYLFVWQCFCFNFKCMYAWMDQNLGPKLIITSQEILKYFCQRPTGVQNWFQLFLERKKKDQCGQNEAFLPNFSRNNTSLDLEFTQRTSPEILQRIYFAAFQVEIIVQILTFLRKSRARAFLPLTIQFSNDSDIALDPVQVFQ